MPSFINYNGKLLAEDMPLVSSGNRGLRYGDGVFETMKVVNNHVQLEIFHLERLWAGLGLLKFRISDHFTPAYLKEQITSLCIKNGLNKAARIRLNVFRKNGGLYDPIDHTPDFVIEAWNLPEHHSQLNENGLIIDIYREARKSCDIFSNLKSNNYLPYAMGALFAKQSKFNDCLILNVNDRVCDATIANVFWILENTVFTPPLSEGCVAGVMRRHLLHILPLAGYSVLEKPLEMADLESADELFLTNALSGIRWVKECGNKQYRNTLTKTIYALLTRTIL